MYESRLYSVFILLSLMIAHTKNSLVLGTSALLRQAKFIIEQRKVWPKTKFMRRSFLCSILISLDIITSLPRCQQIVAELKSPELKFEVKIPSEDMMSRK